MVHTYPYQWLQEGCILHSVTFSTHNVSLVLHHLYKSDVVCRNITVMQYRLYPGILYFLNVTQLHTTHLNVISFTPIRYIHMAFLAVIFMKLQLFTSIICRSVKPSFTQIQQTNVESTDKHSFMHKIKYGSPFAYFHDTHSHLVHVCGCLLYQTLSKSDKKCKIRYGHNSSYTSVTFTELIFFKVTLP